MFKKYSQYPYLIWCAIFIILPLALVIYYSFMIKSADGTIVFSLDAYGTFFEPVYLKVFARSVFLALISTTFCLFLGYPLAYFLSLQKPKLQRVLALLLILPMWMNFLLRTYSWINILGNKGILNNILVFFGFSPVKMLFTNATVLVAMVYNFLPFMVLPIYTALSKVDYSLIEAARDLGADEKRIFFKVVLPLSLPGIISGITMVFMPAVTNFVIPSLLGGGKNTLIGNVVQQQFMVVGDWHFGAAISVIIMLFILVSVGILRVVGEEK